MNSQNISKSRNQHHEALIAKCELDIEVNFSSNPEGLRRIFSDKFQVTQQNKKHIHDCYVFAYLFNRTNMSMEDLILLDSSTREDAFNQIKEEATAKYISEVSTATIDDDLKSQFILLEREILIFERANITLENILNLDKSMLNKLFKLSLSYMFSVKIIITLCQSNANVFSNIDLLKYLLSINELKLYRILEKISQIKFDVDILLPIKYSHAPDVDVLFDILLQPDVNIIVKDSQIEKYSEIKKNAITLSKLKMDSNSLFFTLPVERLIDIASLLGNEEHVIERNQDDYELAFKYYGSA